MFVNHIKNNFENISDVNTVLWSAEMIIIISSVKCTNLTDDVIEISLKDIQLLQSPETSAYIRYKVELKPRETKNLLVDCFNIEDEHTLLNGDNLIIFSNSFSEVFSCSMIGYELVETAK